MNREYKSKLDWKPWIENDSSRQRFKDLFIAMCAQIPHAEDKAACPEQHRLKTSNRLPLPLEELSLLCVRHGQPAAPEPRNWTSWASNSLKRNETVEVKTNTRSNNHRSCILNSECKKWIS
jgi:hypothetical protein